MDNNKMRREMAKLELHRDATHCFEQLLEARP